MFWVEMSWEFLRNVGLVTFACGVVVLFAVFALRGFLPRLLQSSNVAFAATIGDAMMLAGASLAVTAMAVGYLVSNAGPS